MSKHLNSDLVIIDDPKAAIQPPFSRVHRDVYKKSRKKKPVIIHFHYTIDPKEMK